MAGTSTGALQPRPQLQLSGSSAPLLGRPSHVRRLASGAAHPTAATRGALRGLWPGSLTPPWLAHSSLAAAFCTPSALTSRT